MMSITTDTKRLFVAWQNSSPTSRRYYTVGQLSYSCDAKGIGFFTFNYTYGALEAAKVGFDPFPSFVNSKNPFSGTYKSYELFPLFSNRIMPKNRPDYLDYLERLRLSPESAHPFDILARSGGGRTTDSIKLFECPHPKNREDGSTYFETFFFVHGYRYLTQNEQDRAMRLTVGEKLRCDFEHDNPQDLNAIIIMTIDQLRVGWIPRYLNHDISILMKQCEYVHLRVAQVNSTAPANLKLLCRLETCWPNDYQPFSDEQFQIIY